MDNIFILINVLNYYNNDKRTYKYTLSKCKYKYNVWYFCSFFKFSL